MECRGEEGETIGECGTELGAAVPWRGRPLRRWEVAEAGDGGAPLLQAEGGRRVRGVGRVGQKAKQAGWVARPKSEENLFLE
jgi:hypothetical protein